MSEKIVITKDGFKATTETNPKNLKFSSDYGTLKYFAKEEANVPLDASTGATVTHGTYTHNLGYFPYVEIFVLVWIGSKTGNYEYCPLFGSGASVSYNASYNITTTTIELYGEISGVSSSIWNFDFLIFLFKNDLHL